MLVILIIRFIRSDLLGEYDPAFRDLIRKMIQKVPSDRPTMKDVELQLGQLIAATQQQ